MMLNISRATISCGLAIAVSACSGGDGDSDSQPSNPPFTAQVLYSFGRDSADPMGPDTQLVLGSDGNFYGTTNYAGPPLRGGGGRGYGTVFKLTPTGEATVLHVFNGTPDGAYPNGVRLTQTSDGSFYGTTLNGGPNNRGAVFKLTPEGVLTIEYSFTGGVDGDHPIGGVLQGTDGNFYGITVNYFENSSGMVFKLSPAGTATRVFTFASASANGQSPRGGLIQGSDGNFYGTTEYGGTNNLGTVFKLTPAGIQTIMHSFTGSPADGANPNGGLIQGSDGNFYGTTREGGSRGYGTVFKVTPTGVETILHSFYETTRDGAQPMSGLVQGRDGDFYGTTYSGGSGANGTIYKITPAGEETVVHSFSDNSSNGVWPKAGLTLGSDGNLYGTTSSGGTNSTGTFFKLVVP